MSDHENGRAIWHTVNSVLHRTGGIMLAFVLTSAVSVEVIRYLEAQGFGAAGATGAGLVVWATGFHVGAKTAGTRELSKTYVLCVLSYGLGLAYLGGAL